MATVKLGILLPTRGLLIGDNPPEHADLILEMARRVEVAGLDSVWVGDSLTAKPRLEPLAMLAAIAANTINSNSNCHKFYFFYLIKQ